MVHLSVTRTDEEPGSTTTVWTSAAADPAAGPALSAVPVPTQHAIWGRRRLAAATVLAPVLFGLLVRSGGGWTPQPSPAWLALVGAAAAIGALTLASYVPTRGMSWRDTLGCSPCAVVSGGTTIAAAFLLGAGPHQISTALPAVAVVLFGLVQRTGSTTICST